MRFLGRLLGFASILANLVLALFLVGVGLIGSLEGATLTIDEIPGSPESMAMWLIFAGLGGLLAVVLALRPGRFSRTLLVLWSLLVAGIFVYNFVRPTYRFDGPEHFQQTVYLFLGSLVLLLGSSLHWKLAPGRRPRRR